MGLKAFVWLRVSMFEYVSKRLFKSMYKCAHDPEKKIRKTTTTTTTTTEAATAIAITTATNSNNCNKQYNNNNHNAVSGSLVCGHV